MTQPQSLDEEAYNEVGQCVHNKEDCGSKAVQPQCTNISSPCLPPSTVSRPPLSPVLHSPEFEEHLPSVNAKERLGTLNGRPTDRVANTGLKNYNRNLTLVRGMKGEEERERGSQKMME